MVFESVLSVVIIFVFVFVFILVVVLVVIVVLILILVFVVFVFKLIFVSVIHFYHPVLLCAEQIFLYTYFYSTYGRI